MRVWVSAAVALAWAFGCGGAVSTEASGDGPGAGGASAGAGDSAPPGDAGPKPYPPKKDAGKKPDAATPLDAGVDRYTDPGCPDAPPNPVIRECDPLSAVNECGPGDACYPFVSYPMGKCDKEEHGTVCSPAGSGKQGDPCGANCAPGHVCVTGTGQGVICVQMCELDGPDDCPPGFVCRPVDVVGIGGCI